MTKPFGRSLFSQTSSNSGLLFDAQEPLCCPASDEGPGESGVFIYLRLKKNSGSASAVPLPPLPAARSGSLKDGPRTGSEHDPFLSRESPRAGAAHGAVLDGPWRMSCSLSILKRNHELVPGTAACRRSGVRRAPSSRWHPLENGACGA